MCTLPMPREAKLYTTYTFRCSHYYVQEDVKEFTPGYFTQQGVRTETNKVRQNDPRFNRMINFKWKKGKVQKTSTDYRGGKRRTKEPVETASRRTHGSRAESKETQCKMNFKVLFYHESKG